MRYKKALFLVMIVIIFPVLITLISSRVNVNKRSIKENSGRTIVLDYDGYVAEMDMEDFIPCVLMAQMSVDSPAEQLKAQAVVIRTYILYCMKSENRIESGRLRLPFVGYKKLEKIWFEQTRRSQSDSFWGIIGNLTGIGKSRIFNEKMKYLEQIIAETKKMVLKNENGLILPLYHKISNGMTRDGGTLLGEEYKYLKSVKCSSDREKDGFVRVAEYTLSEFVDKLSKKDIVIYKNNQEIINEKMDINEFVQQIDCSKKDECGYVLEIGIGDTRISGEIFAEAMNLKSTSMEIGECEKGIRIKTFGVGHGFGMSISRAEQMANDGIKWKDILNDFFDAEIVKEK